MLIERLKESSNKTRIETYKNPIPHKRLCIGLKESSNKTRIETQFFTLHLITRKMVSRKVPIKQGLKQRHTTFGGS